MLCWPWNFRGGCAWLVKGGLRLARCRLKWSLSWACRRSHRNQRLKDGFLGFLNSNLWRCSLSTQDFRIRMRRWVHQIVQVDDFENQQPATPSLVDCNFKNLWKDFVVVFHHRMYFLKDQSYYLKLKQFPWTQTPQVWGTTPNSKRGMPMSSREFWKIDRIPNFDCIHYSDWSHHHLS